MHPRDRFITVYGRKPVAELLEDKALASSLAIDKLIVAEGARGEFVARILAAAQARGVEVTRASSKEVSRISKSGRQDQGVVADILAPAMQVIDDFFESRRGESLSALALDGVTTPANVGLIIRSAVAAGIDGIVLPRRGSSSLNPRVIKASAGTIFKAPLVRCERIDDALSAAALHGVDVVGLDGSAPTSLFGAKLPRRALYVLGAESTGISRASRDAAMQCLRIPMANGIESLNVACASTLVSFEVARSKR